MKRWQKIYSQKYTYKYITFAFNHEKESTTPVSKMCPNDIF